MTDPSESFRLGITYDGMFSGPSGTFLPQSEYNLPVIPFSLEGDERYAQYKRACEAKLKDIFANNVVTSFSYDVMLSILRANIAKRLEHTQDLPGSSKITQAQALARAAGYLDMLYRYIDGNDSIEAPFEYFINEPLAPPVEVGFRCSVASSVSAFNSDQVTLNQHLALERLPSFSPLPMSEQNRSLKVTRIIDRQGDHPLAVVKTKVTNLLSDTEESTGMIAATGRRTGAIDMTRVEDQDVLVALKILGYAGSDKSVSDEDRDACKVVIEQYLLNGTDAYRPALERYYFSRTN